jgi:hypothetical protein
VLNYTSAPKIDVQATVHVKNEANAAAIAAQIGAMAGKATRQALSDAGAD